MAYQIRENLTPEERSAVIEQMVGDLRDYLLGNGNPGELDTIKDRVAVVERWQERANGALRTIAATAGIGAGIAAALRKLMP